LKLKRAFSNDELKYDAETQSQMTQESSELLIKRRYSFPIEGMEDQVLDPDFEEGLMHIRSA
jgi:hypothetical protein